MFLVSQNSDAHQLQQHAAWAISFLRQYLWVKELQNDESTAENVSVGSKTVSQSFPEDSTVMKLSLWLMHLNYHGVKYFCLFDNIVLLCLSAIRPVDLCRHFLHYRILAAQLNIYFLTL